MASDPKSIKIVFTDIDGTFFSHTQGRVPLSAISAFKKLQKKGIKVFLCSGRNYYLIRKSGILDLVRPDGIVMMNGETAPKNTKEHEACRESVVAPYLPRVKATTTDLYGDTDKAHIGELCSAIRGEGETFPDGGRCFSGIDYATSILEGMLVGCLSQRLNRRLEWDAAKRMFDDADANALIKPYVRKGWEF